MKVFVNDGAGGRKLVEAELIKSRDTTIVVRLPDGNLITRKKSRDLPQTQNGAVSDTEETPNA